MSQESAEESAGGLASRRVSISEESADQPECSDQPETPRNLVVIEWVERCQIAGKALWSVFSVWTLPSESGGKHVNLYTQNYRLFLLGAEQMCAFPVPVGVSRIHTSLARYFQNKSYSKVQT